MGFTLLHGVEIDAEPKQVFDAIATEDGLKGFWTPGVEAKARKGSVSTFRFDGSPADLKMRVDELASPKRIAWTCEGDFPGWEGSTVTWTISKADNGSTLVLFRHEVPADWPDEGIARVNYTWGGVVGRLKALVETGKSQPFLN